MVKKTIFKEPISFQDRKLSSNGTGNSYLIKSYKSLREEARKLVEDGLRDTAKDAIKHEQEHKEKFDELVNRSQKELFRVKSVFPLDFFPDEVIIEPTQVNLHLRSFFWTQQVLTLPIKNIVDCMLDTSPFFASLTIIDIGFGTHNYQTIHNLWKNDAHKARNIIQGLISATKEDIDLTTIPEDELRKKSERLGRTNAS